MPVTTWRRYLSVLGGSCATVVIVFIIGTHLHWNWPALWLWLGVAQKNHHGQWVAKKTLWDFVQLLIIPIALAATGIWFNFRQRRFELEIAQKNRDADRENQQEAERETILQTFLDRIELLLLERDLRKSEEGSEVRHIARGFALSALRGLDPYRKSTLVRFMYESGLINKINPIVDLMGADMTKIQIERVIFYKSSLARVNMAGAHMRKTNLANSILAKATLSHADAVGAGLSASDLTGARLDGADLTNAYLRGSNLKRANLRGAVLRGAHLRRANLTDADLTGADVTDADLHRAILTGCHITDEQLATASITNRIVRKSAE
jgi:uncharacterized protein YjbI with pentapeptide repeats